MAVITNILRTLRELFNFTFLSRSPGSAKEGRDRNFYLSEEVWLTQLLGVLRLVDAREKKKKNKK